MPWVTHLLGALLGAAYAINAEVREFGLRGDWEWHVGIAPVLVAVYVAVSLPFAATEAWLVLSRHSLWWARGMVIVGTWIAMVLGFLPFHLRLVGDDSPAERQYLITSLLAYVPMVTLFLALTYVICWLVLRWRRRRDDARQVGVYSPT